MSKNLNSVYSIASKLARLAVYEDHFITDDTGTVMLKEDASFSLAQGFTASDKYNKAYMKYLDIYFSQLNCLIPNYEVLNTIKSLVDSLRPDIHKNNDIIAVSITREDVSHIVTDSFLRVYQGTHNLFPENKKRLINKVMNYIEATKYTQGIGMENVTCYVNSIIKNFLEPK